MVECTRCSNRPQYIGKTKQSLTERGRQHLNNIEKRRLEGDGRSTSKMYAHFTSKGHTTSDLEIFGIEQIFGDDFTSQTRERYFIDRADTIRNGLNTYRT